MRRALALVLLVVPLAACGTALTPERLSLQVGQAFAGLYVTQQERLGRTDLHRADLGAQAACQRTGPVPDGPGEDWTCTVSYLDGASPASEVFEVQLKPDGCWTADGSPRSQPAEFVDEVTGTRTTNPLAAFDGCLDTSWR